MVKVTIGGVTVTMLRTYVYVAGPYAGSTSRDDYHEIERNISRAREAVAFLANAGIPYFCPHLNSCHFLELLKNFDLPVVRLSGTEVGILWEELCGKA